MNKESKKTNPLAINISLTPEEKKALKLISVIEGVPVAEMVRVFVQKKIKKYSKVLEELNLLNSSEPIDE